MGKPGRAFKNKFGNKKSVLDGQEFDSKGEMRRWAELCLLQSAGEISDLKRQVPIQLTAHGKPICKLIVDYQYVENGVTIHDDFKSPATMTPVFRLKARLYEAQFNAKIRISGK